MAICLPVECRRIGPTPAVVVRTITQNVSTGGLYLELDQPDFEPGDRLNIELTIPPAEGVGPYTGRAACTAEVLRVEPVDGPAAGQSRRFGIAARFLDRLQTVY
jgi:hypothetical protein